MAKRKKKDAACELIAYRFYGVLSARDTVREDSTFGHCRHLWNRMLGGYNTLYTEISHVPDNTPADTRGSGRRRAQNVPIRPMPFTEAIITKIKIWRML